MQLSNDFVKNNLETIKNDLWSYTVLKTGHLQFTEDKNLLMMSITLSNLMVSVDMINRMFENSGINKKLDNTILFKAYESIFTGRAFTDKEFEEYMAVNTEIEKLGRSMQLISVGFTEHLFTESSLDMILMGFGLKKQESLHKLDEEGDCEESFFLLKQDVVEGKISAIDFKKKSLKMLNDAIK